MANDFPRTLAAVAQAELSLWPVVDALVDELATTERGNVRNGEYDRAARYLDSNGFRSWSIKRLQALRQIGEWVNLRAGRGDFGRYPVEWVIEARKKAKSDHAAALAILSGATSKRDIRPDRSRITPGEVVAALNEDELRQQVVQEDPEIVMRAAREAHAITDRAEHDLPERPKELGDVFWKAVGAVQVAYDVLNQRGLGDLALEPEAGEAMRRMHRQTNELNAAFREAEIESRLETEV